MDAETDRTDGTGKNASPLVFISHDTRDAELAEAFSRLLSSVSAGMLKSFRSSDKKGSQGIEYGVEWYPAIMSKLEAASDVVCLLTPNSVGRPWILYEAGVAKGKLSTPVHGVALGIPLQNASTGPFAQFQNSDDSEEALTQLVVQLVKRIPNSDPDREVVKSQVATFREKASRLSLPQEASDPLAEENDAASVAKIFEEIKVMFQDLPGRIERRIDPEAPMRLKRGRRVSARALEDLMHAMDGHLTEGVQLLLAASYFRDEFPWIYELTAEAHRRVSLRDPSAIETLEQLEHLLHLTRRHPALSELQYLRKDRAYEFDLLLSMMGQLIGRLRERHQRRNRSKEPEVSKEETNSIE